MEPMLSWMLGGFVNHRVTTGTPLRQVLHLLSHNRNSNPYSKMTDTYIYIVGLSVFKLTKKKKKASPYSILWKLGNTCDPV